MLLRFAALCVVLTPLLPAVAQRADGTVSPQARPYMLSMPRPEYPQAARVKRIGGRGLYDLIFDLKTGRVSRVIVVQSTGSKILDDAAVSAFSRWRARPGQISRVRNPLNFIPPW